MRIAADVLHQDRLAPRRRASHDPLAHRQRQVAHYFFAMAECIADAQVVTALVKKQDGEQFAIDDLLNDVRDVAEKLVEIECLRRGVGDLEQKVEQVGALAEAYGGLTGGL